MMASVVGAACVRAFFLVLVCAACGGSGDDDGGDPGDGDAADAACVHSAATYTTEAMPGKGTCDPDRFLDEILPVGDVAIEEMACGPFLIASYTLGDSCDGIAELSVVLTSNAATGGRVDIEASACSDEGDDCTYSFLVDFMRVGGRP